MPTEPAEPVTDEIATPRDWLRLIFVYLLIPLILFSCSGDAHWWQAWVFSVLLFVSGIGGRAWSERRHPGLMSERGNALTAADVKKWVPGRGRLRQADCSQKE